MSSAAFSPDGTRVVTTSGDGTAQIWDIGSESELTRLEGHLWPVLDAQFSPDGARIVTALADTTAIPWAPVAGAIPESDRSPALARLLAGMPPPTETRP